MVGIGGLSEVYEVGRGSKTKDRPRTEEGKLKPKDATLASLSEDDVLTKTAKDIHKRACVHLFQKSKKL